MSIENFKPAIWNGNLQVSLDRTQVFASVANREFEGDISQFGSSVKVTQLGDPTIKTYTANSDIDTAETLTDAQLVLNIDQGNYFHFQVDNVDKVQGKGDAMVKASGKAGERLTNTVDTYIAGLYAQSGLSLNTSGSPASVNSLNVESQISSLKKLFDKNDIAQEGRFAIIAPWISEKLTLAGLATLTDNVKLAENGLVMRYMGFDLLQSNNVSIGTPATEVDTRCMAGIRGESWAHAAQLVMTRAYSPERRFADAIKGLHLSGSKVMRPDKTVTWYCSFLAEV